MKIKCINNLSNVGLVFAPQDEIDLMIKNGDLAEKDGMYYRYLPLKVGKTYIGTHLPGHEFRIWNPDNKAWEDYSDGFFAPDESDKD